MPPTSPSSKSSLPRRILARGSWPEARYVRDLLRTETVGGAVLLIAALIAFVWANSPWRAAYAGLRDTTFGPGGIHLDLSIGAWASDGLLAIFFLVAGIELKREFVAGDLSDRRKAALPIAAAVCGVALPAVFFVATVLLTSGASGSELSGILHGWAIPTATDIAFALAVLAVIGTHLPSALRAFLLTLAVVDDLIAITIIAVFYTREVHLVWLALAVVPLVVWHLVLRRRFTNPLVLAVIALVTWGLVHASGVHATVAGVLLGLLVPVARWAEDDPDYRSIAERMQHRLQPFSAGFAVPVFAFFAAGVTVIGGGLAEAVRDPAALGVVAGLVLGKTVGIFGGTWAFARFTRAELDPSLSWTDVFGLSVLGGVGFTVALLVAELSYGAGSPATEHVKFAVLVGSLIAAALAAVVLRLRNRHYARLEAEEQVDLDGDGVPDVFQDEPGTP